MIDPHNRRLTDTTFDWPKLSWALSPAERVMAGTSPFEVLMCSKATVDSKDPCSSSPFRVNAAPGDTHMTTAHNGSTHALHTDGLFINVQ